MRDGRRSPIVDGWITEYRELFNRLDLRTARERLAFEELLAEARARTDGRRERLSQVTPSVPSPLWFVLVLGGCIAVEIQLPAASSRSRCGSPWR